MTDEELLKMTERERITYEVGKQLKAEGISVEDPRFSRRFSKLVRQAEAYFTAQHVRDISLAKGTLIMVVMGCVLYFGGYWNRWTFLGIVGFVIVADFHCFLNGVLESLERIERRQLDFEGSLKKLGRETGASG